ncbi:MAG: hypothetical protein HKN27_03130 [Silicimonas sp.]|nr:hypothetical protein [Silicimonas sp.]
MSDDKTFDLLRDGEVAEQISVRFERDGQRSILTVLSGPRAGQIFEGNDDFRSFNKLRDSLATDGLFPACKGALLYVWPSGMSADMTFGRVAYALRIDDYSSPPPTVRVFDPLDESDDVTDLTTPDAQLNYRRAVFERPPKPD